MKRRVREPATISPADGTVQDRLWEALLPYDTRLWHGIAVLHDLEGRVLAATRQAEDVFNIRAGAQAPAEVSDGKPDPVMTTGRDGRLRTLQAVDHFMVPPGSDTPHAVYQRYDEITVAVPTQKRRTAGGRQPGKTSSRTALT